MSYRPLGGAYGPTPEEADAWIVVASLVGFVAGIVVAFLLAP